MIQLRFLICCLLAVAGFLLRPCEAAEPRFAAMFMSGQRATGAEILDWHEPSAQPRLENRKLFDPADPVRWIEDTTQRPFPASTAFVEFYGGDRLPGRVMEFRSGSDVPYRQLPPHLMVVSDVKFDWPEVPRPSGIPVLTRWLRRIVWQRRDSEQLRPGTLFYVDGRQVEFRSLRWNRGGVRLLLDQDTRDVSFGEIAELHLPKLDPWSVYFEQVSQLSPECTSPLLQIETVDGLRATASTERFQPLSRGGVNPDQWFRLIQPAWSFEPLWVRHRSIRTWRCFRPHEVPLAAIEPVQTVQRSALGGGWPAQLDRNAERGPLRSAELVFGWGLGVHSYSEVTFPFPALAKTFRTQYGLDRIAGRGGCVRAAVYIGAATGQPVHQSQFVIGSKDVMDTGALALNGDPGRPNQLTLVVDPAHDGRPAGTDPLEVRDTLNWLHPLFELDPSAVKVEVQNRASQQVATWQGWTVAAEQFPAFRLINTWDPTHPHFRPFRTEVAAREGFVQFSRRFSVGTEHRFLALSVSRFEKDNTPSRVQVRVEGRAVAEFEVPIRNTPADAEPLLVPVDRFQGRDVAVDIFQISDGPTSRVEWRGIGLVAGNPAVRALFDDDEDVVAQLIDGEDSLARLDDADKHAGKTCLRITPGDKENQAISNWNFPIRGNPNLGEYRYLRFALKKTGGKQIGLHLAADGRFAPETVRDPRASYRYHLGRGGRREYGPSAQWRGDAPTQWEVVTRDLVGDFGEFNLTGLRLACPDGESAAFDSIWLARNPQDFDRLPAFAPPMQDPVTNLPPDQKANVELAALQSSRFGEVVSEVAPYFSSTASEQGVWLFKDFQGRKRVLRTHPPQQGKPCVLRAPLLIPKDKRAELRLSVAPHPQADWQLIVQVNGEKLHDSLISAATTKDGWADLTVDLSKFAGRRIVLEVHNHPNNWSNEFGYWNRLEVVHP